MLLIMGLKYLHAFNCLGTRAYYVDVNKTSKQFHSASTDVATLSIRHHEEGYKFYGILIFLYTVRPGKHERGEYRFQARSQNCEKRLLASSCTDIPRLTKIIRSGITFISRNLRQSKRDVIRRLTSRCLERKQPSRVGGSPLCGELCRRVNSHGSFD